MNKEKIFTIISSIFAGLMVIIGYIMLRIILRNPDINGSWTVTMASNAFQITLLAVLFIQNRIHHNTNSKFGNFFGMVLIVMCIKIVTDQVSWVVDGNANLIWLNWIVCTLTYMCSVPIMVFFWNYCGGQLDIKPRKFIIVNRIVIGLGLVIVILYFVNPFTHIFFSIDEDGWFSMSPTYWLMTLQNVFCCVVCLIAVFMSHIGTKKKIIMSVVFLAPVLGVLFGIISAELVFLQYLCMTLAIFFCYVSVFIRGEDAFKAKMKELDMATAIQRGALREDFGDFKDHKIYAYMKPAREVGGDFYDFFSVDDHTMGVLIADVSGKGIPAAMFMMQGLCAVRELAKAGYPINEVFENANNILCAHNENEFFITAWMAYIDRKTGDVTYVNAGHNPPILKRADGSAEYVRCRPGMVLAAMEDVPYRVNGFVMNPGDTLFMYTDGIPEAQTIEEELYGEERLLALARSAGADPEELTIMILNGVNSFVGQAEQFDDMTIISYERE